MNTTADGGLSHHPAPHRGRVGPLALGFGLVGGPFAWALLTTAGFALARAPVDGPVYWSLYAGTVLLALIALVVSIRSYERSARESYGGRRELLEIGAGRTRFLAVWGILLSSAFALFAAVNVVALILLGTPHR